MKIFNYEITTLEVPNELSICFNVCGCNVNCKNCHSPHLQNINNGTNMNFNDLKNIIDKYASYVSCVCFMGGEWFLEELINILKYIKQVGLKTCLYTGQNNADNLVTYLDYLKTGNYNYKLGGLESEKTNQKMVELKTGKILNNLFKNK